MDYGTRAGIIGDLDPKPHARSKLATLAFERGGLLILAIAVVYAWLTPTYFVDGENAEFSTLSVLGGTAHPSGYPLYVLWLRALSWLPGASAAHTAGLATAILGVAACAVLHAACRAWGARPLAASLTVAMFAAGPVVLRMHTEAEVFAMNNLVLALVLWLAAENGPLRGDRRAIALALIAGLGLCDHVTCALLAPVGILGAVRGIRESQRRRGVSIALCVGALVLALTPYLYLFVAPDTAISWGAVRDLDGLIGVVSRRDYGGLFAFSPDPVPIDVLANVRALFETLGRGWLWLPLGLGLAELARRCMRAAPGEPRRGWQMLAASWLVAGPILIARFNVPPQGLGLLVCQRFHILPLLLLAPAVAVGIDRVIELVARRVSITSRVSGAAIAVAAFLACTGSSLQHHLAIDSRAVQAATENMLRSLPKDAVVISQSDLRSGATYAQSVLGIRPDVVLVTWKMVPMPWYRARLAARGVAIDPHAEDMEGPPSVKVAEQILATGRPLFVDLFAGNIVKTYTTYPHGSVFRVLPKGAPQLSLDEIVALNRSLFAAFDLDYPRPGPDDGYPTGIHERYAATWKILAKALKDANRRPEAREALDVANGLMPQ